MLLGLLPKASLVDVAPIPSVVFFDPPRLFGFFPKDILYFHGRLAPSPGNLETPRSEHQATGLQKLLAERVCVAVWQTL
jgi:hypothetical protein